MLQHRYPVRELLQQSYMSNYIRALGHHQGQNYPNRQPTNPVADGVSAAFGASVDFAGRGAGGAPLVSTEIIAPALPVNGLGGGVDGKDDVKISPERRQRLYDLQDKVAQICKYRTAQRGRNKGKLVYTQYHKCHRWRLPGTAAGIHHNGKTTQYHGLELCNSAWACPVCGPRLAAIEAEKLNAEMQYIKGQGYYPYLVTLTLRHSLLHDDLHKMLRDISSAYSGLAKNRKGKVYLDSLGLVGRVTATEITYGDRNGWHPHKHAVFYFDKPIKDKKEFEKQLLKIWQHEIGKRGYDANHHGVDVRGGGHAAKYLSKWGLSAELTKSAEKSQKNNNMSAFDILQLADDKDKNCRYRALWMHYVDATKSMQSIRRDKDYMALIADMPPPEEEQEPPEDSHIITFEYHEWEVITSQKLRAKALQEADKYKKFKNPELYVRMWLRSVAIDALEAREAVLRYGVDPDDVIAVDAAVSRWREHIRSLGHSCHRSYLDYIYDVPAAE